MSHASSLAAASAPPAAGARLGHRIALVVGAVAATLAAALIAAAAFNSAETARGVFLRSAGQIADLSATGLGGAVRFGRIEVLEPAMGDLVAAAGGAVVAAAAYDAAGAPVHAVGAPLDAAAEAVAAALAGGAAVTAEGGFLTVRPLRFGKENEVVGALALRWSDAAVAETIAAHTHRMIWGGALFALLAAAGVWL